MSIETLQGPTSEPVSLSEIKAYLRISHDEEDAALAAFARTARSLCEAFTGHRLIATLLEQRATDRPSGWIRLLAEPVRSVQAVLIEDAAGDTQPVVGEGYLFKLSETGIGRLRVSAPIGQDETVVIQFWAGLATDWNGVPEALRQGILRLVAHLYAHRDASDDVGPPTAVAALWRPYRKLRLR